MRVLMTSNPYMGHLHPLMPLADAFAEAGNDVAFAIPPAGVELVEAYGFPAMAAGATSEAFDAARAPRIAQALSMPANERRPVLFGTFGVAAALMRAELAAIVDSFHPDVIVHELAELAAAPVARARDIPHVTVGYSCVLPPMVMAAAVDAVSDVWDAEGIEPSADLGLYDHLYLHPLPPSLGDGPLSDTTRRVRPVGFDGRSDNAPPGWIDGFGVDRPAVYLTYGTAIGFLAPWPAMLEAVGQLDVDAVATIDSQVDRTALKVPPNVRVESYIPQSCVLGRVAAVVSHAGAGSMLGAAASGVPQLCIPALADQWENAAVLTGAGAAITLAEDDRTPASIRGALDRLLEHDSAFAVEARRVAEDIAALPHPRMLVTEIAALARAS